MKTYKALIGMNYTPVGASEEVRREPGDDVSDLPASAIPSLLSNTPPAIQEIELVEVVPVTDAPQVEEE